MVAPGWNWLRKDTSSPVRTVRQHRGLDSDSVRWTVIEAGPSVPVQFPPKLANHALARLRRGGIDVRLRTPVAEVTPHHVTSTARSTSSVKRSQPEQMDAAGAA